MTTPNTKILALLAVLMLDWSSSANAQNPSPQPKEMIAAEALRKFNGQLQTVKSLRMNYTVESEPLMDKNVLANRLPGGTTVSAKRQMLLTDTTLQFVKEDQFSFLSNEPGFQTRWEVETDFTTVWHKQNNISTIEPIGNFNGLDRFIDAPYTMQSLGWRVSIQPGDQAPQRLIHNFTSLVPFDDVTEVILDGKPTLVLTKNGKKRVWLGKDYDYAPIKQEIFDKKTGLTSHINYNKDFAKVEGLWYPKSTTIDLYISSSGVLRSAEPFLRTRFTVTELILNKPIELNKP